MPLYEYKCDTCQKTFTVALSVADHDKGGIKCPSCGGSSVTQQFTGFFAKTESKA
jgi:putative FmdB family regulatory protein